MAGFILLLMALGAVTAAALFAVALYRVVVCPLARLARLLLAAALFIPAALLAAILAPIPAASRAVARSYRLIAGGTP